MTSAAPPVIAIEGDSAWIVMIAVSLVTLIGVLFLRRVIDRPGRLASGLLLSLPLALPLIAALSFDHAAFPVVAVLQQVDESVLRETQDVICCLWTKSPDGGFVPYALSDAAGAWMLWVGVSVSSFMLIRRFVGTLLVHRLIRRCRVLDPATERHVASMVGRLSSSIGLGRDPQVLVMPEGVSGAFAVGARQARILVSEDLISGLDEHELEAILAHEIAHIDAHDIGLTFGAGFLRDLVAWNPVAHVAFRKLMADRELEADRRAADMTGDPLAVASGLVKACELRRLMPRRRRRLALAFLGNSSRVKTRVGRLLALADGRSYARAASNAPYLVAAALVAVVGLQTGARVAAQPDGAYLIGWGATDHSTEGFWTPNEPRIQERDGKRMRGPDRSQLVDLPESYTGVAVKKKDIPEWWSEVKRFSRRAGLGHEFQLWRLPPARRLGPLSVYQLVPTAV
ncbi:MAG TPA: M56 family metallopeptidase [Actinomycetota bacterium]|nr:M56 family metallopeptidase [Actinomycetota bacterium]